MIREWLRHRADEADQRVLDAIAEVGPASGFGIRRATRMSVGRVYPALRRLEFDGRIIAAWESPAPIDRPRRMLYRLPPA